MRAPAIPFAVASPYLQNPVSFGNPFGLPESRGYGVSPFGDSGGFPPSFPPRVSPPAFL